MIIAGPCAAEQSVSWLVDWACTLHEAWLSLDPPDHEEFVFKASYDKANRTSKHGPRGLGLANTLLAFEQIKKVLGIRVTTDVHEVADVQLLRATVDIVQIPAFLSRQTDLLVAAGEHCRAVNIKRMTTMGASAFNDAVKKPGVRKEVYLTYRGSAVLDRTILSVHDMMDQLDLLPFDANILDVTHTNGGETGRSRFIAGTGIVLGFPHLFMEVHPKPKEAICDAKHQLSLAEAKAIWEVQLASQG